ncbi:MAG TPA: hypothetical protein VLD67_00730 [Vicinamibacterales bacterium]|nr:hypothetical protein [Vicinamibacterales bacterium]
MGAIAAAGVFWAGVSAQQTQATVPGPGSGIMTVTGTINVGNAPPVLASQAGEWKMEIANVPNVRVLSTPPVVLAPPDFVKVKSRYEVTWAAGEKETVQVIQLGQGGWVRVATTGGRERWINLGGARSVESAS